MALSEFAVIVAFLNRDNSKLDQQNLQQLKPLFEDVAAQLKNAIEILDKDTDHSKLLDDIVFEFVSHFNSIFNMVLEYEPISDSRNSNTHLGRLTNMIQGFRNFMYTGRDNSGSVPSTLDRCNFTGLLAMIQNLGLRDTAKKMTDALADLETKRGVVDSIVADAREKAGKMVFKEYAVIFEEEALSYSSFGFRHTDKDIRIPFTKGKHKVKGLTIDIGTAELWLIFACVMLSLFGYAVLSGSLNDFLPIKKSDEIISQIFTRVLALSMWVFITTFAFRQFSINKHLSTVNRHRANALNSYNLFINSIDPTDKQTRNALILTVSKAIYDQTNTGHLSSRTSQSSPSILEWNKIVNNVDKT